MAKIQGGTLEWNGDKFFAMATEANVRAMNKAAILVQAKAKKLIGGVGSGKLYRRRKQTGKRGSFRASDFHRASAPGQPPARDTGILANSVTFMTRHGLKPGVTDISGMNDLTIVASVGPDIDKIRMQSPRTDPDYGYFLEVGTRTIAKRPWLRPALIKSRRKIKRLFTVVTQRLE
jgi:hypothetical protein